MKYLLILLLFCLFGIASYKISKISQLEDRKIFCQKGWRQAAARYRVYDKISVKQLILDAENFCKGYNLE